MIARNARSILFAMALSAVAVPVVAAETGSEAPTERLQPAPETAPADPAEPDGAPDPAVSEPAEPETASGGTAPAVESGAAGTSVTPQQVDQTFVAAVVPGGGANPAGDPPSPAPAPSPAPGGMNAGERARHLAELRGWLADADRAYRKAKDSIGAAIVERDEAVAKKDRLIAAGAPAADIQAELDRLARAKAAIEMHTQDLNNASARWAKIQSQIDAIEAAQPANP